MQRADQRGLNAPSTRQHNQKEDELLQQSQILNGGTTRRFPRTLDQAFNSGADYGCSITHYRNRWSWVNRAAVCVFCALALVWGVTLWT